MHNNFSLRINAASPTLKSLQCQDMTRIKKIVFMYDHVPPNSQKKTVKIKTISRENSYFELNQQRATSRAWPPC